MEENKILKLILVIVAVSLAVSLLQFFGVGGNKVDYRLKYSQSEATGQRMTSTTGQAPLGSYVATTGSSVVIGAIQTTGGRTIVPKRTDSNAGFTVGMTISSYSPPEEIEAIANAGQGNYVTVMNEFNHGSAAVAGVAYPINVATSATVGSYYLISLVTAMPITAFTTPPSVSVSGNQVGVIELMIPITMAPGTGTLFSGTEITITSGTEGGGTVTVNAGAGTATALTNVRKY